MHNNVCEGKCFIDKFLSTILILLCLECECCEDGSVDDTCDADGKCTCKEHIAGDKCDEAEPGYYEFPDPKRKILYTLHLKTVFLNISSNSCRCRLCYITFERQGNIIGSFINFVGKN